MLGHTLTAAALAGASPPHPTKSPPRHMQQPQGRGAGQAAPALQAAASNWQPDQAPAAPAAADRANILPLAEVHNQAAGQRRVDLHSGTHSGAAAAAVPSAPSPILQVRHTLPDLFCPLPCLLAFNCESSTVVCYDVCADPECGRAAAPAGLPPAPPDSATCGVGWLPVGPGECPPG